MIRTHRGLLTALLGVVVVLAMVAGSLAMYIPTRHTANNTAYLGDDSNPNRLDVTAWITRVDTAAQVVSVSISDIVPAGSLADDNGYLRDDAKLSSTTTLQNESVVLKKGVVVPDIEQRFALDGTPTDYPFDRYTGEMDLHILAADGTELPFAMTLFSTDPFFKIAPSDNQGNSDGLINLDMWRSTPTLVFAIFVMIMMLGLAAAAATAAYYALRWHKGLLFPACSMMATILFALFPLRNAVPGSPPLGSIIDFGSFFIAEIVIAVSLIAAVLFGYRVQRRSDLSG
ncbi:MAG: DUF4436 family protein [Mycobacterium sp.]